MITLHGFPSSNYYNIVKHALLYKEIPFQENLIYAGDQKLVEISPAGKIPVITTETGFNLSESSVICDFIEETYPANPLYPTDSSERAAVRQIMKVAELYFELPSRRLIPYAFSGTEAPEMVTSEVRQVLSRGITALSHLCEFSPWVAGREFTMADIYLYHVNTIVNAFAPSHLDWDVVGQVPGMKEWNSVMSQTDVAQSVEADRLENMPEFMEKIKERLKHS
ncbi:glutathione S-transferase family protein [Vibrio sp. WJH972]